MKNDGRGLLAQFSDSTYHVLNSVYSEFLFLPWSFSRGAKHYWKSEENVVAYLGYVTKKLNIQDMVDWYRVSVSQIVALGGWRAIEKNGGLPKLLPKYFPDYDWDVKLLTKTIKKTAQHTLHDLLLQLFPNTLLLSDYHHPDLLYTSTQRRMELDIYLPSLSLAFEYQGQQHFHTNSFFGDVTPKIVKDKEKMQKCKKLGITLVEVPYWWGESREEIVDMIGRVRGDLVGMIRQGEQEDKY